jgi:hypothetical protein
MSELRIGPVVDLHLSSVPTVSTRPSAYSIRIWQSRARRSP